MTTTAPSLAPKITARDLHKSFQVGASKIEVLRGLSL